MPLVQKLAQRLETDGFRPEEIDAIGVGLLTRAGRSQARQGDDDGWFLPAFMLELPHRARGFQPVHDRHRDIFFR
jgi:hypothetical protein